MPTEAEARAALRAFVAVGELEVWAAAQPWKPVPGGGWDVAGELHGWRFRVLPVAGGVRVTMRAPGEPPTEWVVPAH